MPKVSSVIVPYASYLRVYEPLAAFPEPERSHWARYARRPDRPSHRTSCAARWPTCCPHRRWRCRCTRAPTRSWPRSTGSLCVCPWRTRLRGWLALERAGGAMPGAGAGRGAAARSCAARRRQDYERWLERNPDARPWIRTATWQVPLQLVRAGVATRSGEYDKGREPTGSRRRCCATGRPWCRRGGGVARALRALRDSLDEGPLIDGLMDVGRWLEEFHPRSLVELDYGGLVHVLPAARAGGRPLGGGRGGGDRGAARGGRRGGGGGVRAARGAVAGGAGPAVGQLTVREGCPGREFRFCGTLLELPWDVGPDPGVCVKRDGPHVQVACVPSPSSCQNRTRSPGRALSVPAMGGISALHAMGGLVTPDRHCD